MADSETMPFRVTGMQKKRAVIIGAGPAGLTAAYELLTHTDCHAVVIERDPTYVGGISRTVNYKGNRIDIGGHRFFSKSDRVMRWWTEMLPIELPAGNTDITYQRTTRALTEGLTRADDTSGSNVMHVRPRKTRIIYDGKFFAYPIELSFDTLKKLGFSKIIKIAVTYLYAALVPIRPEKTLEDFFLNRFGKELYETFFKSYTEKVWGVSCRELSAEWGAQRIKGLSISKAILHAVKKITKRGALSGKGVETSLIEQFLYPTFGPGHMWEVVAQKVKGCGGEIRMGTDVIGIDMARGSIQSVRIRTKGGEEETLSCDYLFSTTDIKTLVAMLPDAPEKVHAVASHLEYRDFLTVGLLLEKKPVEPDGSPLTDTWMYIHEPGVHVGRVQLFHNWHPSLIAHAENGWVGLEYFCTEGDRIWTMADANLISLASGELEKVGLRGGIPVIDGVVIRQPKAYPGYFGSYKDLDVVRRYLDAIPNLYPIGRNGMHRYNNQDHSMLTAMEAVECVFSPAKNKSALWDINADQEYHEEKK